MDWDNVRVFLAVARGGQFVAAARRLRLDHATVSRRIAALEAGLGARLFDRRTTGAKLTSAGERFLAMAEQMETAFLQAQAEIGDIDVELTGVVRIGAPDGFSTYYLSAAFRDFAERHPGILIQLVPMPQVIPLARREVDIVVVLDKPEAGRFVARKLTDYSLGIYASVGYLATRKPPRTVADLT
jgi:DNA-binding transcriptional LysR family regulator